jgi:hypothetical protein
MPAKMTPASRKVQRIRKVQRLTRILEALELELIDATDAEILEAAKDLGMDPQMKGSAAFLGLKFPMTWRPEDFFEFVRARTAAATERVKELATASTSDPHSQPRIVFDASQNPRKKEK